MLVSLTRILQASNQYFRERNSPIFLERERNDLRTLKMAGLKSSTTVFMMITMMVASLQLQTSVAQTRHVVGGSLGWTIPSNGGAAYTTWASQQNFRVGDSLVFNFTTGNHNVAEVSQAAYGPCTTANPISLTTTGPATVSLTTAGTHYYICTVGTHCQIGQKLTINVSAPAAAPTTPPAAAPATPPPAAAPTTPPAATPTPAPTPSPVRPPATTPAPSPATPPTSSEAPTPTGDSPPSPSTSGPSPASDTTPPPPSPSGAARSLTTVVVPATLVALALALF